MTGHGLKDTETALDGFAAAAGRGVVDTVVDADVTAAAEAAGLA